MKQSLCAALASLAVLSLLAAPASALDAPRTATLSVTGEGSLAEAPDRATVAFQIQTNDPQSGKATSANAAIANALGAKMAALGVPASAIATSSYSLNFQPRPSRPDPASDARYGYTAERTMSVSVDGVDRAGAIVDAGVAAGATSVGGISFGLRDPHAAQRAVQAAALADAVDQARALAAAAHVRLVRMLSIAPGGGFVRPMPMQRMTLAAAAPVPTTIDPGTLTVQATVAVQYEIAPLP